MEIKFLERALKETYPQIVRYHIESDKAQIIMRSEYLEQSREFSSHTLYLCEDTEGSVELLKKNSGLTLTLLLFGTKIIPKILALPYSCNLFLLPEGEPMDRVSCELQKLFFKRSEIEAHIQGIDEAFFYNRGLQYLAEITGNILRNPIWINGLNYEFITTPAPERIDDPVFNQELSSGHIRTDDILELEANDYLKLPFNSEFPVCEKIGHLDMQLMIVPIRIQNSVVGFANLLEQNHPFQDGDSEVLYHFSKLASAELQKSSFFQSQRGMAFSYFLADLLNNKMNNRVDVYKHAHALGYHLGEYIELLYLPFPSGTTSRTAINNLADGIKYILTRSIYVILDGYVAFLHSDDTPEGLSQRQRQRLEEFLSFNKLCIGISARFSNLYDAPTYLPSAIRAVELGKKLTPEGRIFHYEEVAVYDIFTSVDSPLPFYTLSKGAARKLCVYDQEHGSDFLRTTESFLRHNCSIADAAKEMSIHKNTLRYRMDKIKQITNLSLTDGVENASLLLSIQYINFCAK